MRKNIKYLFILFQIIIPQLLLANPIENAYGWVKQEYVNFRTYPRVDKAQRLMKDGKNKEAKPLLEKALKIDSKNKKTLHLLMKLCIEERDQTCIDKHLSHFKDSNLGYFYKENAQESMKKKEYKQSISYAKKALTYNLKEKDNNFIQLIIMESYIKLKQYTKATKYLKQKKQLHPKALLKWSQFSDNLKNSKYAYILASKLPPKINYLKWKVELLNRDKNYTEASKQMKLLYELEKSSANKKKLLHLYNLTNNNKHLVEFYQSELAKKCDSYALFFLLDYYKNDKKIKKKLLRDNHPYSCLPRKKRELLSLELSALKKPTQKKIKQSKQSKKVVKSQVHTKEQQVAILNQPIVEYTEPKYNHTQTLKSIGYRYAKQEEHTLAIHYLQEAYKLDTKEYELLNNIAYLFIKTNQPDMALYYWELYFEKKDNPKIALKYHSLKAKQAHENHDCNIASTHYEKALDIEENKYLRYDHISLLKLCGEKDKALILMQDFSDKYNSLDYRKELAYMYDNNKSYGKAIENFKYITQKEPNKTKNHIALGYSYQKIGDTEKAIESFKDYIDVTENKNNQEIVDETFKKNTKEMIRKELKEFDFYLTETLRLDNYNEESYISPIYSPSYAGFGDIQLSFSPDIADEHLSLFIEASHVHDYSLKDTFQPSIGVKYKPFKDKIFYLSAQKMFDTAGKFTREDVLLRASTGFFEEENNESSFSSLYLDVSHFTEFDSTLLYGNYEYGKKYQATEDIDIRPYVTVGGTMSNHNDKKKNVTKLDIGLGIATNIPMYETKYESYQFKNRLKLEARQKYLGNTKDDHTLRLQWEFFY